MLHKEFFGILFLAFVAYIFVAPNPSVRIERVCKPVPVTGNVIVSMSALILPQHQSTVQGWVSKFDYGCQYIVWRMVYQKEYLEYQEKKKEEVKQDSTQAETPAPEKNQPANP